MINSITYFQTKITEKLEKIFLSYSSDMTKMAEVVQGVFDCMMEFGLCLLAEELESYDTFLCEKRHLRPDWYIVRKDKTTLLTSLGTLHYHKTLFRNKKTGAYEYFLDRAMGLEAHARMTEDAEARILEEAVQTSYEKGGKSVSILSETVSRETVKNKLHALKFPKKETYPQEMSELRAYYYNKGDMLELIRYQKKELPVAIGSESVIYSSSRMWSEERKRKRELGQVADMPIYSISYNHIKKIANFKAQIFGL